MGVFWGLGGNLITFDRVLKDFDRIIPFILTTLLLLPCMNALSLISTVELIREAIHRVNKRVTGRLSYKTVIVLIIVLKAERRGAACSQVAILDRLVKTHNNSGSQMADKELIRRLCDKGYLTKKKEGRQLVIETTVAGRNYLDMLTRTLRTIRHRF
jgi:predicted transcriptional regulator